MKVVIETTEVRVLSGNSARTGRPYTIRNQPALLKGERVAGPIELMLGEKQEAYAVGEYEIDFEQSVLIGGFGRLELRPVLKPIRAAVAQRVA